MPSSPVPRLLSAAMLAALLLPAPISAAAKAPATLAGNWAGDGFSLRVVGNDTMVQGKCMAGKISKPLALDGNGRFSATGYLNKVGANLRLSETNPKDRPAQFSGRVSGTTLELQVKSDLVTSGQRFRLRRNAAIKFEDCGRSVNFRFGTS